MRKNFYTYMLDYWKLRHCMTYQSRSVLFLVRIPQWYISYVQSYKNLLSLWSETNRSETDAFLQLFCVLYAFQFVYKFSCFLNSQILFMCHSYCMCVFALKFWKVKSESGLFVRYGNPFPKCGIGYRLI